jgi:hypothetical protein
MSDQRFGQHSEEIEKLLRGYGQDLAMSGAEPWTQRFGAPEVALALIPIMAWFLQTILKAVIEHEVKRRLGTKPVEKQLSDFDARLRRLETIVDQATRREIPVSAAKQELSSAYIEIMQRFETLEEIEFTFTQQHTDDLLDVLQGIGLTRRKALRLSAAIVEVSACFLTGAHREDKAC